MLAINAIDFASSANSFRRSEDGRCLRGRYDSETWREKLELMSANRAKAFQKSPQSATSPDVQTHSLAQEAFKPPVNPNQHIGEQQQASEPEEVDAPLSVILGHQEEEDPQGLKPASTASQWRPSRLFRIKSDKDLGLNPINAGLCTEEEARRLFGMYERKQLLPRRLR